MSTAVDMTTVQQEGTVATDLAFDALADPVRREILAILSDCDEISAGELAARIDRVGRTAVSSHLRVLRTAGLVRERREGRYRYYAVDHAGAARDVITLLQSLFQTSLDDVKAVAETAPTLDHDGTAAVEYSDRHAM